MKILAILLIIPAKCKRFLAGSPFLAIPSNNRRRGVIHPIIYKSVFVNQVTEYQHVKNMRWSGALFCEIKSPQQRTIQRRSSLHPFSCCVLFEMPQL